jgi:hypothetical protein
MLAFIATFFLPILASIYFITTHYADQYTKLEEMAYTEAQQNFLGNLFLKQQMIEWFNRLMDFVFWGIIGIIVMVLVWAFSAIRIAIKNHYAQEDFANFQTERTIWHEHFFTVLVLKVALVILITYTTLLIIGRALPRLSVDVARATDAFSATTLLQALMTGATIVGYQLLIICCVKIFKHLQAD